MLHTTIHDYAVAELVANTDKYSSADLPTLVIPQDVVLRDLDRMLRHPLGRENYRRPLLEDHTVVGNNVYFLACKLAGHKHLLCDVLGDGADVALSEPQPAFRNLFAFFNINPDAEEAKTLAWSHYNAPVDAFADMEMLVARLPLQQDPEAALHAELDYVRSLQRRFGPIRSINGRKDVLRAYSA